MTTLRPTVLLDGISTGNDYGIASIGILHAPTGQSRMLSIKNPDKNNTARVKFGLDGEITRGYPVGEVINGGFIGDRISVISYS